MPLEKEVWIAGIKENTIPDYSFVNASTDMSEYVENNTLHLTEAGIEPKIFENYFSEDEDKLLPLASIKDIPHEAILKTYSSEQTRHRNLQEVELAYKKRESVIARHKISLAKNIGKRASFAWSPAVNNEFNKILKLSEKDSIIEGLIDLELFFAQHDKSENLNICLSPEHMARIKKEDIKLYKEINADKGGSKYGFKIFGYSQNPIYTDKSIKKPFGAVLEPTDKRCSFAWATDEVFRCFGDIHMYSKIADPGAQADLISFAQRALVGNIRNNNPKYLAAII